MKGSVRAYFNEAKWLHGEYIVPTVEEYMGVALVSSEVPMFTIISFVGMGMIATKEAFDWVLNGPKIVRACSTIIRLMDDMASHKVLKYSLGIPTLFLFLTNLFLLGLEL